MELIRVNTAKLKVILSAEDMGDYGVTSEEIGKDVPQARRMFRSILDKAKSETGFEKGDGRLYVRVFESADGGCELFVSKKVMMLPEPESTPLYERPRRADGYIAATADFEDLAVLCTRLWEARFDGRSALYYYDGAYRLYLRFGRELPSFCARSAEENACDALNRFFFIGEHAQITLADPLTLAVFGEHGECIAGADAVKRVAKAITKAV